MKHQDVQQPKQVPVVLVMLVYIPLAYLILHCQRCSQDISNSMCVCSRAAQQGRVLQEGHQLNWTRWISLLLCRTSEGFRLPVLFTHHFLCFTVTT